MMNELQAMTELIDSDALQEKPKEQEQQEVDLATDIHNQIMLLHTAPNYMELDRFARHFYELGLKARKEQKPVEIHIDNPNIQKIDPNMKISTSDSSADGKELLYVSNKSYKIGYRDGVNSVKKPAEWSEEAAEKAALEFAYQYPLENGEYGVAKISFMRGAEWQRQQGIVWSEKDEEKKAYDKGFKAAEEFYCGRII